MTEPSTYEAQFLELLPTIDRIAGALARARRLTGADAEDFLSLVRGRFVETDYAALRQHRGEASITTYLTVVITRWLQDQMVARDGRWRPTAAAVRVGPVAILLERLVTRLGSSVDEAITQLMTEGGHGYSERELRVMVRQLPSRPPLRPKLVPEADARDVAGSGRDEADSVLRNQEHYSSSERFGSALSYALASLDTEDRLLVTMRFLDGHTVAQIARALRIEQKPLYRRLDRLMVSLRQTLEAEGITADDAGELLSRTDL
jgi:RNA polymerase sigma factor for flagellar operon FliA